MAYTFPQNFPISVLSPGGSPGGARQKKEEGKKLPAPGRGSFRLKKSLPHRVDACSPEGTAWGTDTICASAAFPGDPLRSNQYPAAAGRGPGVRFDPRGGDFSAIHA